MTVESIPLRPLGRDALAVRRTRVVLETVAGTAVAAGVAIALWTWTDLPIPIWSPFVVVVVAAAFAWWWVGVDHSRWAWRLTSDQFEVRRGVLVRRVHLVPRSRIQNVTTTAGPLQRRFGVLTLTVHTAGARTPNVSVEDLDAGHAEAIRRRLGLT